MTVIRGKGRKNYVESTRREPFSILYEVGDVALVVCGITTRITIEH